AVVFLTGFPEPNTVRGALEAGCVAVISKDRTAAELVGAIRSGVRGSFTTAVPIEALTAQRVVEHGLSPREIDVLRCLADG
ncbi:hypothetical protein, partial [Escherichia coli]|uniref:hypothetical protein n=1 Tax=Escherichia coli TaxID=562 RepID=UPI001F1D80EB